MRDSTVISALLVVVGPLLVVAVFVYFFLYSIHGGNWKDVLIVLVGAFCIVALFAKPERRG